MRDGIETIGGRKQFSHTAIDAMPANVPYVQALFKVPGGEDSFHLECIRFDSDCHMAGKFEYMPSLLDFS
jgi:hypothetical protein